MKKKRELAEALTKEQEEFEELKLCMGNRNLIKQFNDALITKLAKDVARKQMSDKELRRKVKELKSKRAKLYGDWLYKNRKRILAERAERRRAFLDSHGANPKTKT